MDPSSPTAEEIAEHKKWLETRSDLEFFSMFAWRYGSDTYGFNEPWQDELDVRELARRTHLDYDALVAQEYKSD